jgi:long-chain acyl-CoA synthetase
MKLSANKNLDQICVVGDGIPQPIVLVVLSERGKTKPKADLIASLTKTMEVINPKLDKHEKLHNIVVIAEDWTIENNLLTPTMKIKRNAIEKIYKSNYVAWYEGDRVSVIE